MAEPASTSSAARAALNEVILNERRLNAHRVTIIRLVATGVGALLFLFLNVDLPAIAISRWGAWLYFLVAAVIALVIFAFPKTVIISSYAVAFVDVPLLSAIHHLQLGPLGELRYHNVPANLVMMSTLIVAASLSMSLPVIVATATTATASMVLMLYRCDYPMLPILLCAITAPAMAVVTGLLVFRIRRLVVESRSRDLLGKYVLGERIGIGGMAEVFRATYCPEGGFERAVAVKRIHTSAAQDPTAMALFRREAELGALLAHPNLVQVLDFGADGSTYFLAMELVDGCSLQNVLLAGRSEQRAIEPMAVAYVAWCLAEALQHLHEHSSSGGGLVHRDVNPPNVLISRGGDVKLADFGIARGVNSVSLTAADMMRGKLAYSAPEQLRGEMLDAKADLFALGLTLFEMLTGERAFRGESNIEIVKAVSERPLPPLSTLRPDTSPVLCAAIDGLLVKEVAGRTHSARAFLQQLAMLDSKAFEVREGRRLMATWVSAGLALVAPSLPPRPHGSTEQGAAATANVAVTPF